jgi:thioredoxin-dependent peroxiredoxin
MLTNQPQSSNKRVSRARSVAMPCNLRVHHRIRHYPSYKQRGLAVLVVFESPAERMHEYVGRQDAPFALIADPEARLYELYHVESSATKLAQTMAIA